MCPLLQKVWSHQLCSLRSIWDPSKSHGFGLHTFNFPLLVSKSTPNGPILGRRISQGSKVVKMQQSPSNLNKVEISLNLPSEIPSLN